MIAVQGKQLGNRSGTKQVHRRINRRSFFTFEVGVAVSFCQRKLAVENECHRDAGQVIVFQRRHLRSNHAIEIGLEET